jgi:hypothetical protein
MTAQPLSSCTLCPQVALPAAADLQACQVPLHQAASQVAHPHPATQQHQAPCQACGPQACLGHLAWQGLGLAPRHLAVCLVCQAPVACQGQAVCQGQEVCLRVACSIMPCRQVGCSRACRQGQVCRQGLVWAWGRRLLGSRWRASTRRRYRVQL